MNWVFVYGALTPKNLESVTGQIPELVEPALLRDFELVFDQESPSFGAVANISRKPHAFVAGYVALFKKPVTYPVCDFYPKLAESVDVTVEIPEKGEVEATTFLAEPGEIRAPKSQYLAMLEKNHSRFWAPCPIKKNPSVGNTWLFCYGSNHPEQLKARLGRDDLEMKPAIAHNHKRVFSGHSRRWEGAVADLVAKEGSSVYGFIVRVNDRDLDKMDVYEGVEMRAYVRSDLDVEIPSEKTVNAIVYIRPDVLPPAKPSKKYLQAVAKTVGVFFRNSDGSKVTWKDFDVVRKNPPPPDYGQTRLEGVEEEHPEFIARVAKLHFKSTSAWIVNFDESLKQMPNWAWTDWAVSWIRRFAEGYKQSKDQKFIIEASEFERWIHNIALLLEHFSHETKRNVRKDEAFQSIALSRTSLAKTKSELARAIKTLVPTKKNPSRSREIKKAWGAIIKKYPALESHTSRRISQLVSDLPLSNFQKLRDLPSREWIHWVLLRVAEIGKLLDTDHDSKAQDLGMGLFSLLYGTFPHLSGLPGFFESEAFKKYKPKNLPVDLVRSQITHLEHVWVQASAPRDLSVGKPIHKCKSGNVWYLVDASSCKATGAAMRHCGNVPTALPGDQILNLGLPSKKKAGHYRGLLTFIINQGVLFEMKGFANSKPAPEYHPDIVELLELPLVQYVRGGTYLRENDFHLSQLEPSVREKLLEKKPGLASLVYLSQHDHGDYSFDDIISDGVLRGQAGHDSYAYENALEFFIAVTPKNSKLERFMIHVKAVEDGKSDASYFDHTAMPREVEDFVESLPDDKIEEIKKRFETPDTPYFENEDLIDIFSRALASSYESAARDSLFKAAGEMYACALASINKGWSWERTDGESPDRPLYFDTGVIIADLLDIAEMDEYLQENNVEPYVGEGPFHDVDLDAECFFEPSSDVDVDPESLREEFFYRLNEGL